MARVEEQPGLRSGVEAGVEWKLLLAPDQTAVHGYARIPAGHPWSVIEDYDDIPVDAPGELTYGPEPEQTFFGRTRPARHTDWIGFDTSHAFDHWPDEELAAAGAPAERRAAVPRGAQLPRPHLDRRRGRGRSPLTGPADRRGRHRGRSTPVTWTIRRPRAGDIGEPLRHIELEPLEAPAVPAAPPVPAVPAVEPEPVPA